MSISLHPRIFSPFRPAAVSLPRFGNNTPTVRVLVVSRSSEIRGGLASLIRSLNKGAETANSFQTALTAFDQMTPPPDYVLLDYSPISDAGMGIHIAKTLLEKRFPPERIIFTHLDFFNTVQQAMREQGIPAEYIPDTPSNLLEAAEAGKIRVPFNAPTTGEEFEACLKPLS